MKALHLFLPFLLLLQGCQSSFVEVKAVTTPKGTWSFNGSNVRRIILRSYEAKSAVITSHTAESIDVSAVSTGGALGHHSPDPDWKETPAAEWGTEFVGRQYGHTLVISSRNETGYIHHNYELERFASPSQPTSRWNCKNAPETAMVQPT